MSAASGEPTARVAAFLDALPEGPLGVAVSGGSDSLALLVLLVQSRTRDLELRAVTVDHGLRPESAREAAFVAEVCRKLGVAHDVLVWEGDPGTGNLQDRARNARRRLISAWAHAAEIGMVALGHTQDDQAETFLMRLARGSGVDGLAAMAPEHRAGGITWLRPLLSVPRAHLRHVLEGRGIGWIEDPSNSDPRFARVRAREMLADLETLGLGPARLAATASRMARARDALDSASAALAAGCLTWGAYGEAALDPAVFAQALPELRMRVLAGALCRVSGDVYRPRESRLTSLCVRIVEGGIGVGATLHGCVLRERDGSIAIRREPAALSGRVPAEQRVWDRRWRLDPTEVVPVGAEIGALGAGGLSIMKDWRRYGVAREVLIGVPALWRDDVLLGTPLSGTPSRVAFDLIADEA